MFGHLNKGISTPVAMGIVVVIFILASAVMFQFYLDFINEDFGGGEINVEGKYSSSKKEEAGLIVYRDEEHGFEFKHPENFFYSEPKILAQECNYEIFPGQCPTIELNAPSELKESKKVVINDTTYCSQTASDSGMGSSNANHYYTTVRNNMCFTVHLVVQFKNCGAYGSANSVNYKNCIFENAITKPQGLSQAISTFKFIGE
jgi:hypothetical protein